MQDFSMRQKKDLPHCTERRKVELRVGFIEMLTFA